MRQILKKVSDDDPKKDEIKSMVNEILSEQNRQTKFKEIKAFISFGADVASIAANILFLKQNLPQ